MSTNQEITTKLARARATLILDQPFFGELAMRLTMVEDAGIKTLNVNGKEIRYNPDFVDSLTPGVLKSAVAHEVMHCVLDHMDRLGERSHSRWNKAADFKVNQILEEVGFELGKGWLRDKAYDAFSADHVYSLLPEGEGEGPGEEDGPMDDIQPGPKDEADKAEMKRDWKVATIQAANSAKAVGNMPGALDRFLNNIMKPQVDWKAVLRAFVNERCKDDYSWLRPNRAMLVHGYYMPGLYSESMGEIVIGVDTSGSITDAVLAAFSAECDAVIAATQPSKVHVVYCDAEVNRVDEFSRGDVFGLKACGGGGTRFKPVFDHVDKHGIKPVCLIYLTDLYGDATFAAPGYPTLWCCTTSQVAPWGDTVQIEVS